MWLEILICGMRHAIEVIYQLARFFLLVSRHPHQSPHPPPSYSLLCPWRHNAFTLWFYTHSPSPGHICPCCSCGPWSMCLRAYLAFPIIWCFSVLFICALCLTSSSLGREGVQQSLCNDFVGALLSSLFSLSSEAKMSSHSTTAQRMPFALAKLGSRCTTSQKCWEKCL